MTDESSLIAFVWHHRAEPLPRLVYADWLDDIGDEFSAQKSAFLRLWCRLHDTPLTDLDGYPNLASQLESLKPELPAWWLFQVDGERFVLDADRARVRADTFLLRFLHDGEYRVDLPSSRDGGWVVSFNVMPTIGPVDPPGREKEHKRGGTRKSKRTPTIPRRVQSASWQAATPLFVEKLTGRVDWYRGPGLRSRAAP